MLEIQFCTSQMYKNGLMYYWSRMANVKWWKHKHLVHSKTLQAYICNESTQIQEENGLMQPEARKVQREMGWFLGLQHQ